MNDELVVFLHINPEVFPYKLCKSMAANCVLVYRRNISLCCFLFIFVAFGDGESLENFYAIPPVPYALSPVYLQYLENVELHVYNVLKNATSLSKIDENLQGTIQRYLLDYEQSVSIALNVSQNIIDHSRNTWEYGNSLTSQAISSNPILSLQMINRFVKYFRTSKNFTAIFDDSLIESSLPNTKEVEDAMDGLLRLQYIYDLDAYKLANGILQGIQTNARLTARECFELGKLAQENAYFNLALQWYDVTLDKLRNLNVENDPTLQGIKVEGVLKAIRETIEEHNEDYEESMEQGDMYSFSKPIQSSNYSTIAHLSLRKRLAEELTGNHFDVQSPKHNQAVEANMMALCTGGNFQSEKVKAKLKCFLDTKRHPYWKINPLKVEVLSESPQLIQIYDIFSDSWIDYLKSKSYPELVRAPQPPEATPRTAAYAWFDDSVIPELPVSKVVGFITGLNVEEKGAAEELQVAAYAFGAHVAPHHDSFYLGGDDEDDAVYSSTGNQMSTFLIYLNEVEQGGLTAFPLVGISIKPVKNSAVLWYTKLKNGDVDNRTLHAACPVIKGHKWIATKWARIGANFLRRPCGLRQNE